MHEDFSVNRHLSTNNFFFEPQRHGGREGHRDFFVYCYLAIPGFFEPQRREGAKMHEEKRKKLEVLIQEGKHRLSNICASNQRHHSPAAINHSNSKAKLKNSPKSGWYRFRPAFLCFFLLQGQKKEKR